MILRKEMYSTLLLDDKDTLISDGECKNNLFVYKKTPQGHFKLVTHTNEWH